MKVKLKKKNNINFDWVITLKTNKILTKIPRVKMINQKNKEQTNWRKQYYIANCNLKTKLKT
jgi:hypothetical protein